VSARAYTAEAEALLDTLAWEVEHIFHLNQHILAGNSEVSFRRIDEAHKALELASAAREPQGDAVDEVARPGGWRERAERAEAELARLRDALNHAVLRDHRYSPEGCSGCKDAETLLGAGASPPGRDG